MSQAYIKRFGRVVRAVQIACAFAILAAVLGSAPVVTRADDAKPDFKSFAVTDLNGREISALPASSRATVLIFILHDCPVCNQYAPEISRIAAQYARQGVATYAVYEERDLTLAQAREHAKSYALKCGFLYDPTHRLAESLGAVTAPDAVLLASDGTIVYQGRIDNRFVHFGMANPSLTVRDLRDALDSYLSGKKIAAASTPVVGCQLPRD